MHTLSGTCKRISQNSLARTRVDRAKRRAHVLAVNARLGNDRERKVGPNNMSTEAGPSVEKKVAVSCLGSHPRVPQRPFMGLMVQPSCTLRAIFGTEQPRFEISLVGHGTIGADPRGKRRIAYGSAALPVSAGIEDL